MARTEVEWLGPCSGAVSKQPFLLVLWPACPPLGSRRHWARRPEQSYFQYVQQSSQPQGDTDSAKMELLCSVFPGPVPCDTGLGSAWQGKARHRFPEERHLGRSMQDFLCSVSPRGQAPQPPQVFSTKHISCHKFAILSVVSPRWNRKT